MPVKLLEFKHPVTMVVVKGFGGQPMMLLDRNQLSFVFGQILGYVQPFLNCKCGD